jgi:hypothetical protein
MVGAGPCERTDWRLAGMANTGSRRLSGIGGGTEQLRVLSVGSVGELSGFGKAMCGAIRNASLRRSSGQSKPSGHVDAFDRSCQAAVLRHDRHRRELEFEIDRETWVAALVSD